MQHLSIALVWPFDVSLFTTVTKDASFSPLTNSLGRTIERPFCNRPLQKYSNTQIPDTKGDTYGVSSVVWSWPNMMVANEDVACTRPSRQDVQNFTFWIRGHSHRVQYSKTIAGNAGVRQYDLCPKVDTLLSLGR